MRTLVLVTISLLALAFAGCLGETSEDEPVYTKIDEISPSPALVGDMVWLNGSAPEGRPGTIACGWFSHIDGSMGGSLTIATNALSPGTHTIYLECHDTEGTWLERAITTLTVSEGEVVLALDSTKRSNGDYSVTVLSQSIAQSLDSFEYTLKDKAGSPIQSGEIALQNLSGKWHGIDVTNDGKTADHYTDADQAQVRIDDVQAGNQSAKPYQKGEGTISLSFFDNDKDGQLTAGDMFMAQGNDGTHMAEDGYAFEITYGTQNKVVGTVTLG